MSGAIVLQWLGAVVMVGAAFVFSFWIGLVAVGAMCIMVGTALEAIRQESDR